MIVNAKKQVFAKTLNFESAIDNGFEIEICASTKRLDFNGVRLVVLTHDNEFDQRFDVHLNDSISDELFDTLTDFV